MPALLYYPLNAEPLVAPYTFAIIGVGVLMPSDIAVHQITALLATPVRLKLGEYDLLRDDTLLGHLPATPASQLLAKPVVVPKGATLSAHASAVSVLGCAIVLTVDRAVTAI